MNLSGVFPPIPTPFEDDAVDHRALASNVDRWMRTRLTGLVVLGSNAEAPLLEDAESDAIIDTARQHVPRDRTLIGGVGRESTAATIAAAKRAAQLGVDIVLVRTPSFYKNVMTSDAFVRHYSAVADASPVPILLYNVSMFTGVNLLPDAVERLSQHTNIVGMKESNSDLVQLSETIARTPDDFVVLCGSAATFYAALSAGASGAVLAIAAVLPDLCMDIFDLVRAQRHADALALQRRITPLGHLLGALHGVAGLKYALDQLGYVGGPTRSPLGTVPSDAQDLIREQLVRLKPDATVV
ncbi:MAG TPA: dihydrodipicolinate synthase family protein [Vicinamibacterales bacterium]|nr:dihydrodipicolinate synthase family protein [Vicinamibacterales bacterium]